MAIKLGIIGAGAIGSIHAQAAANVGVEVAAVADVNEAAARKMAEKHQIKHALGDPRQLWALPDIHAVVVAAPNKFHAPLAMAALKAGKHVLVEKPMGLNAAECREMNAVADHTGRLLQVGFVQRFSAVAGVAQSYVSAGRLGRLYHAKANYCRRRGIPGLGGWFTTKALSGGGPLIDLGVHIIDLVTCLAGFPKPLRVSGKVYAHFGPRMKRYVYESMWAGPPKFDGTFDVEDAAHALVRFEGGLTLEVNTTWAANLPDSALPNEIALLGDQAGLVFALGGNELRLATEDQGHNVDLAPKFAGKAPFDEQMKAFAAAVEQGTPPLATGEQGRVVQAIIDAIYESSRLDREVEVQV